VQRAMEKPKPKARSKARGKAKANKGGKAGGKAKRKGEADATLGDAPVDAKGNAKGNSKGEAEAPVDAPPMDAPPVDAPPVDAPIECHFCGESYPENDCRCVSKVRGEFACVKCYSSRTCLYRAGEFPLATDQAVMSEEDRHSFWLNCQSLKGEAKADLARRMKRKQVQSEMDSFAEGGEFLPLGVWKTKGFDAERIEANSTEDNKTDDSVLGLCYRVVIKSKHWKKDHGAVFEDENIYQPPAAFNLKLTIPIAAASSSKDVSDQIQAQLDKVKEMKEQEKADKVTRKKLLLPLNRELAALNKIAANVKAEKAPTGSHCK
jgi:hypothetical protein